MLSCLFINFFNGKDSSAQKDKFRFEITFNVIKGLHGITFNNVVLVLPTFK